MFYYKVISSLICRNVYIVFCSANAKIRLFVHSYKRHIQISAKMSEKSTCFGFRGKPLACKRVQLFASLAQDSFEP